MDEHRYASSYCEENVWWLAQEPRFEGMSADVVVISNEPRAVAMRAQRAGGGNTIVWDYHVVLAAHAATGVEVWDLDCTLGAPIAAARWLDASFDADAPVELAPLFRVAPTSEYIEHLATDRRHMRRADGSWSAPPPPWPILGDGAHDLDRWIDMRDATYGVVIDLAALRARWRVAPAAPV